LYPALAAILADYLRRIAAGRFEVTSGDDRNGLSLPTVADFPVLKWTGMLAATISPPKNSMGDRDLPGTARGGRLPYLAQTIPRFYALGTLCCHTSTRVDVSVSARTDESAIRNSARRWYDGSSEPPKQAWQTLGTLMNFERRM